MVSTCSDSVVKVETMRVNGWSFWREGRVQGLMVVVGGSSVN